jgi:hypothetical protein
MKYWTKAGEQWVPLKSDGFWADPASYSTGEITTRCPMSETEAYRAVWLAMKENRP